MMPKPTVRMVSKSVLVAFPLVQYIVLSMGIFTTGVILPELISELRLTAAQAGSIFSLFTAVTAIVCFLGGYTSDRVGRKVTLVTGATVFCAAFFWAGTVSSYLMLLICYAFAGFGYGMYSPSVYALMGEVAPNAKGLLVGAANSVFCTGGFLGPWIASLLTLAYGWRYPYYNVGIIGLVLAATQWALVKPSKVPMREFKAKVSYRAVLKIWNVLLICLGMFLAGFGFGAFLSWAPSFLRTSQGLGITEAGLVFGAFSIGGIAGSPMLGWLSDRIGRKIPIVIVGILGGFLAYLFYAYINPYLALVALSIVFGFIFQPYWNLQLTLAQESVNTESIGTVTGMTTSFAYAGSIVSPMVVSGLLSSTSMPQAMVLCGAMPILFYGLIFLGYKTPKTFKTKDGDSIS